MLLQGTDGLHEGTFKAVADTHNLSGSLHLCGQCPFGGDKLVKRKAGQLHHAVIQGGFKAGICLSGYGIFNLIQRIAQGYLGRNLGNRITGSLACQGRGTAHTGIHFNDAVFKADGMKGKLYVAAAGDLQLVDNI